MFIPIIVTATFDAVVLAVSPHAAARVAGLSLRERGRRVAARLGARRDQVVDDDAAAAALPAWDAERGDAALLVLRAGDQVVHTPLVEPLLAGRGDLRVAVGPDGAYAGAALARGPAAAALIAALARDPAA